MCRWFVMDALLSVVIFICAVDRIYGYRVKCLFDDQCNRYSICIDGRCQAVSSDMTEVLAKQSCPETLKKKCFTDIQCLCSQKQMVCRENECNYFREEVGQMHCMSHDDCGGIKLCEQSRCREASTLQEITMLLHYFSCKSNGGCQRGYYCQNGGCVKRKR